MALTFLESTSPVSGTPSATPANLVSNTLTNGTDHMFIQVVNKRPSSTPATPAGWTRLLTAQLGTGSSGNAQGKLRVSVFYRKFVTGDVLPAFGNSGGGAVISAGLMVYRAGESTGTIDFATTSGSDTSSNTSWSVTGAGSIDFAVGDHFWAFAGFTVSTPTTSGTGLAASGITFGTISNPYSAATTTGDDLRNVVWRTTVTAGTGTQTPSHTTTLSVSSTGGTVFVRGRYLTNTVVTKAGGAASGAAAGGPKALAHVYTKAGGAASGAAAGGAKTVTHPVVYTKAGGASSRGAAGGSKLVDRPETLNVSLWAVDPDSGDLSPLPHYTKLSVSPVLNGIGKITAAYPYYGLNQELLADNITSDRDLEVEIWLTGKQEGRLRGILTDTAGDDVAEDAVWTFEGWFLEVLLDEVLVWPQSGAEKQELILSAATAGTIVATILDQVQVRGGLVGVTRDFSTTLDSNGTAWTTTVSLNLSPQATLLEVLQELVALGMIDGFELTPDRVLRLWNPGRMGVDRTLGPEPIIFRRGRNLLASPRRHTVRNSGTTSLVAGAENLYASTHNATAFARRGRRIEVAGSANNLKDSGSVLAYSTSMALQISPGAQEITHGLAFGAGHPRPLVDFGRGDWVWSDTRGALERLRVAQLTLEYGPEGYDGDVVLNTPIVDKMAELARKLKRISSGAAVVGTSTASPEVDDGKHPAQVLGVTATSDDYLTNAGVTQASVQAGWTAVTTNADATTADDITGYFPAYRYGTGQSLPTDWQVQAQVSETVADWSGVAPGKTIEVRVAAVDRWGRLGAWSAAYSLTSGADATPPPTPSTPVVDSYLGLLVVTWDGLGSVGETQPGDFDHVDVHVSTSSGFTANASNRVDRLSGKGTIPWDGGTYGVTYYAKLIAYDRTGNASASSAQDSAVLAQAGDGDISAVSIGKLTAGILSAIMTVSSIIRTGTSGSRWEADTAGFRCYDSADNVVLDFDIATGELELSGQLTSGDGVGVGSTIVVDPGSGVPRVTMYPDATLRRFNLAAFVAADPTGAAVPSWWLESWDEAGNHDGPILAASANTTWMTFRDGADYLGGGVKLYPAGTPGLGAYLSYTTASVDAFVHVQDTGGVHVQAGDDVVVDATGDLFHVVTGGTVFMGGPTSDTKLQLASDGSALLGAPNNNYIQCTSGGTQVVSNGVVKSFVIPHPVDDDRWLVHACTESPQAGVEYWGEAVIVDHQAIVELPAYFEALCEPCGRQVQVTVQLPDEPRDIPEGPPPTEGPAQPGEVWPPLPPAPAAPEWSTLPVAAASAPRAGRFRIACSGPDGTRVAWLVKATRRGAAFDVEPLRTDVDVHGDGPYRWIQAT